MIREMTYKECIAMIAGHRLARLACAENDTPYVIPICYAYSGNWLYAFSMPGRKLDMLRINSRACLLVEALQTKQRWKSVVIDATFHELANTDELHPQRLKAWSLLAEDFDWWEPGALTPRQQSTAAASPHVFFGLEIVTISGREAIGEADAPYEGLDRV